MTPEELKNAIHALSNLLKARTRAPADQVVFVAYPRRPGWNPEGEKPDELNVVHPVCLRKMNGAKGACSLLNLGFNRMWARALNCREKDGLTHFAMQHDDIVPLAGWADTLIDEMDRVGADVMSAVIPLKDERGLTSTGIRNWMTGRTRRLTMAEVFTLPETFGLAEVQAAGIMSDPGAVPGDELLVVNTGLWVCRFTEPWIETFPGFRSRDQIIRLETGAYEAVCLSEDWLFSEWAARRGLKVFATRKTPLAHCQEGREYRNDSVWGTCRTDPGEAPKSDEAVACGRRTLDLKPDHAAPHNPGAVFQISGKLDEAVACYRRALQLKPDYTEAHNSLGIVLANQGMLDEAAACFQRAVRLKPDYTEAHNNLGVVLKNQGKLEEAVACCRTALRLQPQLAEAHNNLGNALKAQGKLDEAVACYRRTLELKPDDAGAHNNLASALKDQGRLDEAVVGYRRALELKPDYAEAHSNLGLALQTQGKLDEAAACLGRALQLKPDLAEAHHNLGVVLKNQGKQDDAIACFGRAMQAMPDDARFHNSLAFALWYIPGYDARAICAENERWNERHAAPFSRFSQPHANDRSSDRRLRIGYLSPDFRDHVVGRNLAPLFSAHDHGRFEIFCYANRCLTDDLTRRFQTWADGWLNVAGLSDERLAQRIREDRIDILVDLALRTEGQRLLVFARKPAPVQATFAGYPGTTGLTAIDYRLTDPYLDPPDQPDDCYTEASIRLPDTFWCYDPLGDETPVGALPAESNGHITFGCLNNFCKVNAAVLTLWARVLRSCADARLAVLAGEGRHRQETLDLLAGQGVAAERVTFHGPRRRQAYLELYHGIDICLDTFPYNGHTTSLDTLWMGVPVVTLVGETVVGRAGLSQLTNLGLPELIARTPQAFVDIAVELAGALPRLRQLRAGLRARMHASPLMDNRRFARGIEAAYLKMWQAWCARNGV